MTALEEHGLTADPMKLQKLLYFTHGYYLAVTGNPWVNEPFEAWAFGPVVPSIYYDFQDCGSKEIPKGRRTDMPVVGAGKVFMDVPEPATEYDDTGKQILSYVLDKYGSKTGVYLSNLTHKVGSPWHQVWAAHKGNIPRNTPIDNNAIKDCFLKLIAK